MAKIGNFASKNSNIIIKGLIRRIKDYFPQTKFEMQKNNVFNKFLFLPNFFPYRFIPNFTKVCDFNNSGIRIFTTLPFLIFGNKFL